MASKNEIFPPAAWNPVILSLAKPLSRKVSGLANFKKVFLQNRDRRH